VSLTEGEASSTEGGSDGTRPRCLGQIYGLGLTYARADANPAVHTPLLIDDSYREYPDVTLLDGSNGAVRYTASTATALL